MRRRLPLSTWLAPADHGRRPYALVKFSRELHAALQRAGHSLRAQLRLVPRHDGTEREREMYHQRLDACGLILQVLMHYCDGVTLIVGRGEDGHHYGLKLETIAELTGLHPRRVDRALRDLHLAGFLTSHSRAEKTRDGYRGLVAVRQISLELFYALGLGTLVQKLRQKLYARRKARQAPQERAQHGLAITARENRAKSDKRRHGAPAPLLRAFLPDYSPG